MTVPPFQQFFDANADVVLGLLVTLVGRHEAEDCFQETFIAALRAYHRLAAEVNPRAWVLTIARNKAIDNSRATRRRALPSADAGDGIAARPSSAPADPELWQAVGELPEKQRAAIFLRYVADLSHREVAAALQCSEAAARRSAHEGLKKLKEACA